MLLSGESEMDTLGFRGELHDAVKADGGNKFVSEEVQTDTGFNKAKPPEDDCCPICYGEFKIPCKVDCGHWFCGGCVLQLWEYQSRPRQCRCPFCNSAISYLTTEPSALDKTDSEVCETLQNIAQFNRLYAKGMEGFLLRFKLYLWNFWPSLLRGFIMVSGRSLAYLYRVLANPIRHPERIIDNFRELRALVFLLTKILFIWGIYQPGNLRLRFGVLLSADFISGALVCAPYVVRLCVNFITFLWLRIRKWKMDREVAALRAQNDALKEAIVALKTQNVALKTQNVALITSSQEVAELLHLEGDSVLSPDSTAASRCEDQLRSFSRD